MYNSRVFTMTRLRLTAWYAGVMSAILSLCGFGFYQMMTHAHWEALHRELESVAGTLHDSLEPILQQPGQLTSQVSAIIPGLCWAGAPCRDPVNASQRHVLGAVQQEGYYVRFLNQSGQLIATVGQLPDSLPDRPGDGVWQTVQTPTGQRYHHLSLLLKTAHHQPWGYLQVGRSLQDFDNHLAATRWIILLGLPITILLVSGASWWLAGLAMRPVYQSYRQIQQFTADAAHELRTPLAATRATVESALELHQLPTTEARSVLQTIERQNIRLSQLVQDLLLLSRMDVSTRSRNQQSCNLNTLILDVVDEFESLAIAHHVSLKTDLHITHSLLISGDDEQLYRLLANLVTNAIQYTPEMGSITMTLKQDDHDAVVQVQDTGIGISLDEQTHIFDRFYRVNSDRSRQTGGAGLGLAIALAIAQAHHGTLKVDSTPGQGSTFTLRLPLKHHA